MQNELYVAQTITHPNVMYIYELLEDNSNIYIVSEYLDGGELTDLMKKGAL